MHCPSKGKAGGSELQLHAAYDSGDEAEDVAAVVAMAMKRDATLEQELQAVAPRTQQVQAPRTSPPFEVNRC